MDLKTWIFYFFNSQFKRLHGGIILWIMWISTIWNVAIGNIHLLWSNMPLEVNISNVHISNCGYSANVYLANVGIGNIHLLWSNITSRGLCLSRWIFPISKFQIVDIPQWEKMKISLSLKRLKILKDLPKLATSNTINTFKYHYFVPK